MNSKPFIAVIADTQLHKRLYGLQDSRQDWFDAFNSAIDQVLKRIHEVSAIFMPGDILDKEEVGSHAAFTVLNGLKKLSAHPDVPIFILLGNHDQPEDTKLNWVRAFQLVHPNVIEPTLTTPISLAGCPNNTYKELHILGSHHLDKNTLATALLELTPPATPTGEYWILLHQALKELAPHPDSFEVEAKQIPTWISKVILGDFHDFDVYVDAHKRDFIYPGSTETVSFNQSKAPGFIFINRTNNVITHCPTQQREYITVNLKDLPLSLWKNALLGMAIGSATRFGKLPVMRIYYPAADWENYAAFRSELRTKVLNLIDAEESVDQPTDTTSTRDARLPTSRAELVAIAIEELAHLDTPAKEDATTLLGDPTLLSHIQKSKFSNIIYQNDPQKTTSP